MRWISVARTRAETAVGPSRVPVNRQGGTQGQHEIAWTQQPRKDAPFIHLSSSNIFVSGRGNCVSLQIVPHGTTEKVVA
jgi:hypothetical protein